MIALDRPTHERPRVVVIGDVMLDIYVRAAGPLILGSDQRAQIQFRRGGSAANQAAWMAKFGLSVTFVARVGRPDVERISQELANQSVIPVIAGDDQAETGRLVVILDPSGERSFYTDRGANERLSANDVPREAIASADFIQFSGYSLVCDTTRDMMRRTIALLRPTPFGFDPASAAFIREFGAERVLAETAGAAVIFPNEDEAEALTGAKGPIEQVEALGRFYPLVVLKRGRRGCLAFCGGAMIEATAPDVGAIDLTGAGDAFVAAFLADHLRGRTLEAALRSAVAAGALAVQTIGATPKS